MQGVVTSNRTPAEQQIRQLQWQLEEQRRANQRLVDALTSALQLWLRWATKTTGWSREDRDAVKKEALRLTRKALG